MAECGTADIAALYSRVADIYVDKGPPFFAVAGRRLVELADVRTGDIVLDVGTGRGAVLLPAAERVGPQGEALGIDLAPGMIEATNRELRTRGLGHATAFLMDAAWLQVPAEHFSHALSGFSVFFLSDVLSALVQLRGALRPDGSVGFAFSRGEDPRWRWYADPLRAHGVLDRLPRGIGDQAVRNPGRLKQLLDSAGFVQIREYQEPTEFSYASVDAWWESLWTHGSRRPLELLDQEQLAAFRVEANARAAMLVGPNGLAEHMELIYVLARKPSHTGMAL